MFSKTKRWEEVFYLENHEHILMKRKLLRCEIDFTMVIRYGLY